MQFELLGTAQAVCGRDASVEEIGALPRIGFRLEVVRHRMWRVRSCVHCQQLRGVCFVLCLRPRVSVCLSLRDLPEQSLCTFLSLPSSVDRPCVDGNASIGRGSLGGDTAASDRASAFGP